MFEDIETSTLLLVAAIILILWFILLYYFYRFVFSLKRQLWNQRQQINLLLRIAQQLGIPESDDQLDHIRKRNNSRADEHLD